MQLPYIAPLDTVRSPFYADPLFGGIKLAASKGDGYTIALQWYPAYPDTLTFQVAYNIYYSTNFEDVFNEGVKYVIPTQLSTSVDLVNFTPGEVYYFSVRATEYDPTIMNLSDLPDGYPDAPYGVKVYSTSMLTADVSNTDMVFPITDVDSFPPFGVVKIGIELVKYSSVDSINSTLIIAERGIYKTEARNHNTNGFDGYHYEDPVIHYFKGFENTIKSGVNLEESKFDYPNELFTYADGYKEREKDIITSSLEASDAFQEDFRSFDYSGWRRLDPISVINGGCIGSYIGGEFYCADGYAGVGRQVRGVSVIEQNNQRQEMLLEATGDTVVLVRRMWKGKVCRCVGPARETPEPRCPTCLGSGFQVGYEQFFNPRRSDGRILVRIETTTEDVESQEAGFESKFLPNCWTMVYPAVKDRDFFIRFNEDGTEEFRYEILNVSRNKLFQMASGATGEPTSGMQKFAAQRVRKTDPIYQFRTIRSTAMMPQKLTTSVGFMRGANGALIPHTHEITINEGTTQLFQVNQTTSVSSGHNHPIISGVISEILGHQHTLIIP